MSKYFAKRLPWAQHLANGHVDEAIKVMVDIMRDPENDANIRLSAAKALIERAAGKPHQSVSIEQETNDVIELNEVQAAAVLLEEFGDRGALPPHVESNDDDEPDGEPN
jgi:hypothetical protein